MLNVWLDGGAQSSFGSGIWRYTSELEQELLLLDQMSVFKVDPKDVIKKWHFLGDKARTKLIWPYCLAKYFAQHGAKVDIFHGLCNLNAPISLKRSSKTRFVVTVHDIIPLLSQSGCSLAYKMQFRYLLPKVLAFCDAIVCPSLWTLDQIVERYPFVSGKITHIPNGFRLASKEQVKAILPINEAKKTLLAVSRYEPYKRLDFLLEIMKTLPLDYTLTIVTDAKGALFLQKAAKKALLAARVIIYSQLTDDELSTLYQKADLFLHPSLYEGFGLPPLEAAGVGVPVLFTEGNALMEYLPQACSFALKAQLKPSDWAQLIEQLIKKETKRYLNIDQSWIISWQSTAYQLKGLYNNLM